MCIYGIYGLWTYLERGQTLRLSPFRSPQWLLLCTNKHSPMAFTRSSGELLAGGAVVHYSTLLHYIVVLDSARMTGVYPFHAFMHKPCNTANILTLRQISQAGHGQASKAQPYAFSTLALEQLVFFVIYWCHKSSPNSLLHLRQDLSLRQVC
jgi:hypothetical protein